MLLNQALWHPEEMLERRLVVLRGILKSEDVYLRELDALLMVILPHIKTPLSQLASWDRNFFKYGVLKSEVVVVRVLHLHDCLYFLILIKCIILRPKKFPLCRLSCAVFSKPAAELQVLELLTSPCFLSSAHEGSVGHGRDLPAGSFHPRGADSFLPGA